MTSMLVSGSLVTTDLNDPHTLVALSVPPGSRVLYAGDAQFVRALRERRCSITLVDNGCSTGEVEGWCERVIPGDIEEPTLQRVMAEGRFDTVLLADLLDRVTNPSRVLLLAREYMEPTGRLVVTEANALNRLARLQLLCGRVPRPAGPGGLPLRLLDRAAIDGLLLDAGWRIEARLRVMCNGSQPDLPPSLAELPAEILRVAESGEDAGTDRFIFIASLIDAPETSQGMSLVERLQARVFELESEGRRMAVCLESLQSRLDTREQQAADLERQMATLVVELSSATTELTVRVNELHGQDRALRAARSALAVRDALVASQRADISALRSGRDALYEGREAFGAANERLQHELQAQQQAAATRLATNERLQHELQAQQQAAATRLATLTLQLSAAQRERDDAIEQNAASRNELAASQAAVEAWRAHANSAGFRIVNSVCARLRRFGRLYGVLRATIRRVARPIPWH